MKERTPIKDIILFAAGIALLAICSGCSTKSRHLDISGAYLNQAGTVAIGSIEAQSAPEGVESAMVSYEDSAAWFSDAKEHRIRILLTGTNSVTAADGIVSNICAAFTATAPQLSTLNSPLSTLNSSPARTPESLSPSSVGDTPKKDQTDDPSALHSSTGTAGDL
jgi:hypothetical protein